MEKNNSWGHESELGLYEWIQCEQKEKREEKGFFITLTRESENSKQSCFTKAELACQRAPRIYKELESKNHIILS